MSSHGCAAMAPMIFGARWVVTDSSPKTKQKAELQLRHFEVHYDQVHYDQVHYDPFTTIKFTTIKFTTIR
jgi:hypothetical protein